VTAGARRRPARLLASLAMLTGLLAGCGATIPESGPVVEGPAVGAGTDSQVIRVIVRPPVPGSTAVEVVRGFLEASASFQDDYGVAREYLTPEAAATWDPAELTRVYDGSATAVKLAGLDRVSFVAPLVALIDTQGSYQIADPGEPGETVFQVRKVDGEWRISDPPQGLLLSRGDVDRGFRTYNVYFLDPSFRTLVPDPITVPSIGSGAATTLIRRLLDGPSEWLAPAVRTAFPIGGALAVDSVPVDNGIAQVTLDSRVLATDDSTRAALSAQIVWTLRQVPEVLGVRITAGGLPLPVPGQPSVQPREAWPSYDPDALAPNAAAFALTPSGVVRIGPESAVTVPGDAGTPKRPIISLAVAPASDRVAGFDDAGKSLLEAPLTPEGAFEERARGKAMTSLGYGPDDSLWWVESGGVRTIRPQSEESEAVPVEGIGGAKIVGLVLARDGTRAVLLLRRGPRTEPVLVRVERRGESVKLAAPRRFESRIGSAVDVAWASSTRLQVLGSDGAGPVQLFSVGLGAEPVRSEPVPDKAVTVTAAPSRAVFVGTDDGGVYVDDSFQWRRQLMGSSPAYPG